MTSNYGIVEKDQPEKGEENIFDVEDIKEEDVTVRQSEKSFRETRTKKLRLSKKQEKIPGVYF